MGEAIGDYAAFNETTIDYSAVTSTPCELLVINIDEFKKILGEEYTAIYKEYSRKLPDDYELRRRFLDDYFWKKIKRRVLKKTISESITNEELKKK